MAEKTNLENPEKLGIHLEAGAGDGMLTSALYIYNESEETSIQDTHTTTVSIKANEQGELIIDNATVREDVTLEMANSNDPVVLKSYVDALIKRVEALEAGGGVTKYIVKIYDYLNGNLLESRTVNSGSTVEAPESEPTRTGYTFNGWSKSFPFTATADTTVYGKWLKNTFTVRFYDYDGGTLISTQTVNRGESAVAPKEPTRSGYTFDGWDKSFTNVTSDLVVNGTWKEASSIFIGTEWQNHVKLTDEATASQELLNAYNATPYSSDATIDMLIDVVDVDFPNAYDEVEDSYTFTEEEFAQLATKFYIPAGCYGIHANDASKTWVVVVKSTETLRYYWWDDEGSGRWVERELSAALDYEAHGESYKFYSATSNALIKLEVS